MDEITNQPLNTNKDSSAQIIGNNGQGNENNSVKYAGFAIRLQAQLIDILLNLLLIVLMWYGVFIKQPLLGDILKSAGLVLLVQFVLFPSIMTAYSIVMTSKFGGTFGKLLSGIKVKHTSNRNLTINESLFRYLVGYYVSGVLFGAGFYWITRDKQKRGWHDQVSETVVIVSHPSKTFIGIGIAVVLAILNAVIIFNLIQSIKVNTNLHKEIYENIKLWEVPALEIDKPAGTIEPNSKQLVI